MASTSSGQMAYMSEPHKIELRSYELPTEIESHAVLLQVLRTNVCCSDIHVFEGKHPVLKCGDMRHEMVGRVLRLGAQVHSNSAGTPIQYGGLPCLRKLRPRRVQPLSERIPVFGQSEVFPHFHGATFATHYYVHENQDFYRAPARLPSCGPAVFGARCWQVPI